MERVTFLIDGFNLYHALNDNPLYTPYKWLDLWSLAEKYITRTQSIEAIYYFTALPPWSPNKQARHELYVKALKSRGVNIVYGKFRRVQKNCTICTNKYWTYEEKQTDVNIAIHLFKLASKDHYDKLILITGDSDLIPSIQAVKSNYPTKNIGVVIPIGRRAEELKHICDHHMKMKQKHLKTSIFPNEIVLPNGTKITRPTSWT